MIETTTFKTGNEARKKIILGVNKVLEVIAPTLGPAGRSVLLPRTFNRGPRNADDGYMAAENVLLKDPHERLAAEAYKEGIKKTNQIAGDGTTGTGVLSAFIINKIFKEMPDSDVPIVAPPGQQAKEIKTVRQLHKELNEAKNLVIEEIKKASKPIKTLADLEKVAFISMNDEDTAKIVAKTVWEVARDATGNYVNNHIDIVDGYKGEIETEVVRGMRFPAKVSAPAFVNKPEKHEMVAEQVHVLLTNFKLDNPFFVEKILREVKVPKIAIFSPEFSTGVLQYMVKVTQGGLHVFPVTCPALRTAQMEDLAYYTGANVIDKDKGAKFENTTAQDLGFAEKIVVREVENKEDAVLLGGRGENEKTKRGDGTTITDRIKVLKGQLKECRNDIEKAQLEKRIANLSSAVGIIRVGSTTSGEGLYTKLKIEDGVYACKGALEEGYVHGGGMCLKKIAEKMPKNILTEALQEPYEQLKRNAGGVFEVDKDVIDPAKVIRLIVEHGVSVAATLITTHAIVAEEKELTPGDGYKEIAKAIKWWAYFDAKHKGMLLDSENEAEKDREAGWEKAQFEDKD